MKLSDIKIFLAIVFVTTLFTATAFAAYEFYVIHLSQKAGQPIDWASAEKSIRSVTGVTNVRVDQRNGNMTIVCSEKCTSAIKSGVAGKLKGSGISLKQIGSGPGEGTAFPKIDPSKEILR